MNDIQQKISEINGQKIGEEMDEKGYVLLSQFLPVKYCKEFIDEYDNEDLYRKIITMEKYRFGLGEYKYFKYPLPNSHYKKRCISYTCSYRKQLDATAKPKETIS